MILNSQVSLTMQLSRHRHSGYRIKRLRRCQTGFGDFGQEEEICIGVPEVAAIHRWLRRGGAGR